NGSFSVNFTVYLSGVSILSICSRTPLLPLPGIVRNRSYVYFTSSAVSSLPLTGGLLCQRTPFLSLNTYVGSFGCVHASVRSLSSGCVPGTTAGPALTFNNRLMQYDSGIIVLKAMVWCGSKCTGRTACRSRKTPPRFGVCASAVDGAATSA